MTTEEQKQGITNHILNGNLVQAKGAINALPEWYTMTGFPILSSLEIRDLRQAIVEAELT